MEELVCSRTSDVSAPLLRCCNQHEPATPVKTMLAPPSTIDLVVPGTQSSYIRKPLFLQGQNGLRLKHCRTEGEAPVASPTL